MPVLMCSSVEDKKSVMQSISLGASDYIKKPIKPETLLLKVKGIIAQKHKTIMIVDDEKMIRELLGTTLGREGYNTIAVESGLEALKILESQHVDAVVSDIQMDGMDGLALLKAIKSKYADLPVMMISGYSNKYNKNDVNDVGADGYITKPFKNFEILKAIQNILSKCPVS